MTQSYLCLGLCESSILRLEYSVEFLIEYIRLTAKVAVNYRVVQNRRTPGSHSNLLQKSSSSEVAAFKVHIYNKSSMITKLT